MRWGDFSFLSIVFDLYILAEDRYDLIIHIIYFYRNLTSKIFRILSQPTFGLSHHYFSVSSRDMTLSKPCKNRTQCKSTGWTPWSSELVIK